MESAITIRPMVQTDLEAAIELWSRTDGVEVSLGDSPAQLSVYLERNPGMSHVVMAGNLLVGAALAGHDGRRGFLYHVAVDKDFQGQGHGHHLVEACVEALRRAGVPRSIIFVLASNGPGKRFWTRQGWFPFKGTLSYHLDL